MSNAMCVSTSSGTDTSCITIISESSAIPAADDAAWTAVKPSGYTFSCVNGTRTLYARARDSLGNVSSPSVLSVELSPLPIAWNGSLVSGQEIAAHESISFTAGEPLSASGLSVTGTLGVGLAIASGTGNSIVTVKPGASGTGLWQAGTGTITAHCVTAYGLPLDVTIAVKPFNGVCVSTTGSDGNEGGVISPCKTIAAGITKATAKYGTSASVVRVAKGTYSIDSSDASQQIKLAAGVTVKGEYSADCLTFSPAAANQFRSTVIKDIRTVGGNSSEDSITSTVLFNSLSGNAEISYAKIEGAPYSYCPVVQCVNSVMSINHCDIINGGGATERFAIRVYGSSTPIIQNNNINYDPSSSSVVGGSTTAISSIGIRINTYSGANGEVINNTITGGLGDINGIVSGITFIAGNGSIKIHSNKIIAGVSSTSYGIRTFANVNCLINVYNNLFLCGNSLVSYGVFLWSNSSFTPTYDIRNNTFVLGAPSVSSTAELGIGLKGLDLSDAVHIDNNLFYVAAYGSVVCMGYETAPLVVSSFNNNYFVNLINRNFPNKTVWAVDDNEVPSDGFTEYDEISSLATVANLTQANNALGDINEINGGTDYSFKTANTSGLNGGVLSWGFLDDYLGALRTGSGGSGWSIGYLEKD